MKRIMVFRFSSLGDVAMTIPVLIQVQAQNPSIEILFVSRKSFEQLFQSVKNLTFIGVDVHEFKGLYGLFRLYKYLKKFRPDVIIDLHSVLRTHILRFFFRWSFLPVFKLEKGRAEKRELTRKKNKKLHPLKSMHERYADVFRAAGCKVELEQKIFSLRAESKKIGFAPLAKFPEKTLPIELSKQIAYRLANQGFEVFLFGGKEDAPILDSWKAMHPNICSLAGKLSLSDEVKIMKELRCMIAMDSANMHIASLAETSCISVWGATHPYLGFLGYGQSFENCVQVEEYCRPCSVFGSKKCYRDRIYCLEKIQAESIIMKCL